MNENNNVFVVILHKSPNESLRATVPVSSEYVFPIILGKENLYFVG